MIYLARFAHPRAVPRARFDAEDHVLMQSVPFLPPVWSGGQDGCARDLFVIFAMFTWM